MIDEYFRVAGALNTVADFSLLLMMMCRNSIQYWMTYYFLCQRSHLMMS